MLSKILWLQNLYVFNLNVFFQKKKKTMGLTVFFCSFAFVTFVV